MASWTVAWSAMSFFRLRAGQGSEDQFGPHTSRFADIQPSGSDTGSPLNLRKRLDIIDGHLPLAGARVLDGGCGTGQFVMGLLGRGADAHGVEMFAHKVEEFGARHPEHASRMRQGNIEQLPFPDGSFDGVLLNEVMEHVVHESAALLEARRVLVDGGRLVLFSPNRLYPFETHGVDLKQPPRALSPWVPLIPYVPVRLGQRFIDYRARNYWPWELRALVAGNGFDVVSTGFVWQMFENISGHQPRLVAALAPLLRSASRILEKTPLLRAIGTSQVILAHRRR